MKGKKIIFPLVAAYAAVILTCCTGRTSGAKQCNPVAFPMVKTPTYIIDQEQAVRFLAKNFWDDFFKIQHPCTEVSTAVHGVDSISFLKAFGMYAQLAFSQSEADCAKGGVGAGQTVEHSVAELIANMDSLALKGDRKPLLRVMELVEHYFYDPNSPVLNEEIYLCALNGIMAAKSLSDLDKMQYKYQQMICSLNRTGTPAADFVYEQAGGKRGKLYGIKGDYTLVFFNNPGCNACGQILEMIVNSPVAQMVAGGKVKVLAMYIDEDLKAWKENCSKFPKSWIYAHDPNMVLRDNNIYGLRAIPSLYLLDKEKRVILKDAPVEKVISYLLGQTI